MSIRKMTSLATVSLSLLIPAGVFAQGGTVIRTETREVLVDAVVTDKKGTYIRDLTVKDFKVQEDGKDVALTGITLLADSPAAKEKQHMLLFFDNTISTAANQANARKAAQQFLQNNAQAGRVFAVAEFNLGLRLTVNFTEDVDKVKQAISNVQMSSVAPQPAAGSGTALNAQYIQAQLYVNRNLLRSMRQVARSLAPLPGRKSLIFFSQGFNLGTELQQDLKMVIDACNQANVAIYGVDIGGLDSEPLAPKRGAVKSGGGIFAAFGKAIGSLPSLAFQPAGSAAGFVTMFQGTTGGGTTGGGTTGGGTTGGGTTGGGTTGGGTTGTTGGTTGGGTTGTTGGTTGGRGNTNTTTPQTTTQPGLGGNTFERMDTMMEDTPSSRRQVLQSLARETGGFVIGNSNDLLAGLDKVGKEQREYYLLSYTPTKEPEPGKCHTLKVRVSRGGTEVRARNGYCDSKPLNMLSGTAAGRDLEAKVNGNSSSTVPASMLIPHFYTSANVARVSVAMEVPANIVKFAKDKGKMKGTLNVLGIGYLADGSVGSRFSDSVKLEFEDQKQVDAFMTKPYRYEKQFEVASGEYTMKVAFAGGTDGFGKLEAPLSVKPYDPKQFAVSGLALSKEVRPANALLVAGDSEVLEDRVPLVINGVQVTPSGSNKFKKTDPGFLYGELYEPALAELTPGKDAPGVGVGVQFLDPKTNEVKLDFGVNRVAAPKEGGNAMVPFGFKLPVDRLPPGQYNIVVTAVSELGGKSIQTAAFEITP